MNPFQDHLVLKAVITNLTGSMYTFNYQNHHVCRFRILCILELYNKKLIPIMVAVALWPLSTSYMGALGPQHLIHGIIWVLGHPGSIQVPYA